eukprot:1979434-Rhodomonas_salina.2
MRWLRWVGSQGGCVVERLIGWRGPAQRAEVPDKRWSWEEGCDLYMGSAAGTPWVSSATCASSHCASTLPLCPSPTQRASAAEGRA